MAKKSRKYYSLLVMEPDRLWTIQFGDYDRSVVSQEGDDTKDDWRKGTKMRIICTGDKQAEIQDAVNKLNTSIAERRKAEADRTSQMAAMAKANPNMSIRQIEEALNLKPTNSASAFRKGTQARADEERCYAERLAAYNARNGIAQ